MLEDPTHPSQPYRFSASSVTVRCGGAVHVTNRSTTVHTFSPAHGGFRDTGSMSPNAMQTVYFFFRGSYGFMCNFHPWMRGTVHVT